MSVKEKSDEKGTVRQSSNGNSTPLCQPAKHQELDRQCASQSTC